MATVTGSYVTGAGAPLPPDAAPRIVAFPSKNAVTVHGQAVSTREVPAVLAADGTFSFDLVATVDVLDRDFHYMIRGSYLDPNAYGETGRGHREWFELKLLVPEDGGSIDELLGDVVVSSGWTIVSLTEPPVVIVGAGWLHADPNGDPELGTGDYYEGVA